MITFYDIPSKLPQKAWSPNTFKVRIALNYKRIPYKTEWVEFIDIEPLLKKLGGLPTGKKSDGRDHYTLPAIFDSNTREIVTESEIIVAYLDKTYPDTPSLFPLLPGGSARAAIAIFEYVFMDCVSPIFPRLAAPVNRVLNPPSDRYHRTQREELWGNLDDLAAPSPNRDAMWKKVKENLDKLSAFYERNGAGKPFLFGDTFSFADSVVLGYFAGFKIILGEESDEWKALENWNNARWGKLVESMGELLVVDTDTERPVQAHLQ